MGLRPILSRVLVDGLPNVQVHRMGQPPGSGAPGNSRLVVRVQQAPSVQRRLLPAGDQVQTAVRRVFFLQRKRRSASSVWRLIRDG